MMQSPAAGVPFDARFVLWLFAIMGTGVVLAVLGFVTAGVIAFRGRDETSIRAFVELFSKGDVLRLLTVTGILVAVVALTFAKLIEGAVAASILSGVAGYVLGGMSRRGAPSTSERQENHVDRRQ